MPNKINVFVIDDSVLIRTLLTEILNSDPEIEVVGTAKDPLDARDKIKQINPDVLTLDIEMPRMDGITFLRNLMRLRPMPVVMISTLTAVGAAVTLEALELGAIDFIFKPKIDVEDKLKEYSEEIISKVKVAAQAKVQSFVDKKVHKTPKLSRVATVKKLLNSPHNTKLENTIIALGASTGGTEAIKEILLRMPIDSPAIVIIQHIPIAFSLPFSKRMNDNCDMQVNHAQDGQKILPGNVYIAPGSHHLRVEKKDLGYICRLDDGPLVNRHKPSVDVLFSSVATEVGNNSIAVLLTGMGSDGAKGMKQMHDNGSPTIIQDEASSVVWGMPGAAYELKAVDHILSLNAIAEKMLTASAQIKS